MERDEKVAMDREDAEGFTLDTEHVAAAGRQLWRNDADFEAECDRAYFEGTAMGLAEQAERVREYETSAAQREWEGHDNGCESEFITEAGMYSPCRCAERAEESA